MGQEGVAFSTGALEDVSYLARSDNRVRILAALAAGPATRRELQDATGTSRTTLDRIVNELEDRGWAERTADGEYAATPTGEHLIEQFEPFVESVEAIRRLDDAVAWLPTDELSIGLEQFSDATVYRPETDPTETVDYYVRAVRAAEEFYSLTDLVPPVPVSEAIQEGVADGRLTGRFVATDESIDYLQERPERRDRWREILRAGADLFRYEGTVPCNVWVVDGTVLIKESEAGTIPDSYGAPIVSTNDAVRSWAFDLIDRFEDDASRVDETAFASD